MTRFAQSRRVVVFEEPIPLEADAEARLDMRTDAKSGVTIATPRLPEGLDGDRAEAALERLLDGLVEAEKIERPVLWYYTPMMLGFSRRLAEDAACVVYDCMDELSNFRFAPERLKTLERDLVGLADVVFTGGYSLYEAKRGWHANIHPFPSSVDRAHFAKARAQSHAANEAEPDDQAHLPHPRLGFYGVIDERMDLQLIAALADAHPDWSIVMVGPVVKVDPADLPRRYNLHYLGGKGYADLPKYLAGWDVALMPFAINESTRFISPTKTPEYLAGGKPVVSTAIVDVIRHYGELDAVRVADDHQGFIAECEAALAMSQTGIDKTGRPWLEAVDKVLADLSWDTTYARMAALVDEGMVRRSQAAATAVNAPAIQPAGRRRHFDYLICGAGFAGSVLAERLASQSNKKVLLIDRRPHVGGNAYDKHDEAGILFHQYGPHIFHTNSDEIVRHLSQFTGWRTYEHKVLASVDGQLVPIPINRTTVNMLYGLNLTTDEQCEAFLKSKAEPVDRIRTSEDVVVSAVGRELYEKFFQGYTRKQWGVDPSQLDKSVTSRVPTRTNTDDRYFNDSFQAMPKLGFTHMFENMLDHDNITIMTETEFADVKDDVLYDRLVFTGPVDEFFDFRYGKLPYRSLRFVHQTHDMEQYQPVAVVNYPHPDTPYTRISEYKHLTGQKHAKTSITFEYPSAEGDPYYPIPREENQVLYKKYEALALARPDVSFVGRLATYKYYNMDQVVGQALATYRRLVERERAGELATGRELESGLRA
ncbi:MAG: UDP-galactopyranose mutase [Caulobacterales bacterium 32-69-10]|nr:MAG: UDP-galactopyranose mutase [Caulobacterales bacterium 32-69-10]